MIVCPVCEHSQASGTECDQCGKLFVVGRQVAVASAPLVELEPTTLPDVDVPVQAAVMTELDRTSLDEVGEVARVPLAEFEGTPIGLVGEVPTDPIPEMETTGLPDDGQRTLLPDAVTCRYCGNAQASGLLCEKCGMRIPRPGAAAPALARAASEGAGVRCPACGTQGKTGAVCSGCGSLVRRLGS